MKLIVGLGNPGLQFERTRHNFGFIVIDKLVQKFNLKDSKLIFNSVCWEMIVNSERVFFVKPQTYINLSGDSLLKIKQFYKINIEDIVVIYDNKCVTFGKVELKLSNYSYGHNGVKDILEKLKIKNVKIKMIMLGIGTNKSINVKDWVLSEFSKIEFDIVNKQITETVYQIIYRYLVTNEQFSSLIDIYN